jgi:hypothetical protein
VPFGFQAQSDGQDPGTLGVSDLNLKQLAVAIRHFARHDLSDRAHCLCTRRMVIGKFQKVASLAAAVLTYLEDVVRHQGLVWLTTRLI